MTPAPGSRPRPVFFPDRIPAELRDVPQWVPWGYSWNSKKSKWDKPPRRLDGSAGSSTAPDARYSFEMALSAAKKNPDFDGVGLVLTSADPYVGIDLDDCVDSTTDVVAGWAQQIVKDLDSYTERSPSGAGLRIMVRAKLPPGGRRKGKLEMYDDGRYVTMTGDVVASKPVAERQAAVDALHARAFRAASDPTHVAAGPESLDDRELVERAQSARNGAAFAALWRGDAGDDHSVADLRLCGMLAFWTAKEPARIDRLFRASGLMRPKWDERHGERTYGAMTIAKAIEGCRDVYELRPRAEPRRVDERKPTESRTEQQIRFVRADAIEPVAIAWFERDRIPAGELSILEGDGGTGKSTVALDYLARKTRGRALPGGTPTHVGTVLVVADEDAKTTIAARLQAAQADLSRVLILTHLGPAEYPRNFILPDDCTELSRFIAAEAVEVVYLDALFNHFAHGMLPKNPQDARMALTPLANVAHETGATIIGTRHWGKGARDASERGLGAAEIKNVARSVLVIAKHPEVEDTYAVAVAKKNYGRNVPALTYRIVSQQVYDREGRPMRDPHGEPFTVGRIEWGEDAALSADDLAMAGAQDTDAAAGREACTHFLLDLLADGELPSARVYEEAGKRKFSASTTLRAAKSLRVIMRSGGFPKKTVWALPPDASQSRQPAPFDATEVAPPVASVASQSPQYIHADVTEEFDVTAPPLACTHTVTPSSPPTRARARDATGSAPSPFAALADTTGRAEVAI